MPENETVTSPAAAETTTQILLDALKRLCDTARHCDGRPLRQDFDQAREVIAQAEVNATKTAFLVLQEGGSSTEMYVHGFDTPEDADRYRFSCRDEGSYRTSEVIEVPELLAEHPDFWAVAEAIAGAVTEVDYPDGDAPESDEDTDEGEEG